MVKRSSNSKRQAPSSWQQQSSRGSGLQARLERCVQEAATREDRAPGAATSFEPVTGLELRRPDTAILLLHSPEKPILLAAAAALASFAAKAPANLLTLFDLDIVDSVTALLNHEDIFTRRFALKLLALMAAVRNVQVHLLKNDFYIVFFTEMLISEKDLFLQEFSSRILAELSSDLVGSAMFLEKYPDASFLYEKLKSADADIMKNSIEIVYNLLRDFSGLEVIFHSKDFSFSTIYNLFKQPYPAIQQVALDVVERLVMHSLDDFVQERFRESGGVRNLLDILDQEEWTDLHSKVLRILDLACDNKNTADLMNNTDGTKRLFDFMEKSNEAANEELKIKALAILVTLADSKDGKQVLYAQGFVEHLVKYFEVNCESSIHATICQGIAKMTQYSPAAYEISLQNPTNFILSLLNNEKATWLERQSAALAIKKLFLANYQNCTNFLDYNGQVHLLRLIEKPIKDVPMETRVIIVQAIGILANYSSIAQDLVDYDLFNTLCGPFQPEAGAADELKIACCEALSRFPINDNARRVLVNTRAVQKLYPLVQGAERVLVRSAAVKLLLLLSADPVLARLAIHEGYLFYMLKNRSVSRVISTWEPCIKALFKADLPMKFAYTGRLSLNDITEDGFYIMRRLSCPFLVLEELFRLKLCPLEPIYVVNFADPQCPVDDDYFASKQAAFSTAHDELKLESMRKGLRVSDATINSWLELKFGRLQRDPDLQEYLEMLRAEIRASEDTEGCGCDNTAPGLTKVSRLGSRARLLGGFVARQLAGASPPGAACVEQQLELHLREIECSTQTSVIPLGNLRLGSYLERALLFKVLADRIGLPASLARGRYGKSWIEVAVPQIENLECVEQVIHHVGENDSMDSELRNPSAFCPCSSGPLPTNYLRENFIVDLMNEPGQLIPIGSPKAKIYCDRPPKCLFSSCCSE